MSGLAVTGIVLLVLVVLAMLGLGIRYIPNDRLGIVEKLWSSSGSSSDAASDSVSKIVVVAIFISIMLAPTDRDS